MIHTLNTFTEFGNRRTVSVNQNQGGSLYPFDADCELAGLVSDISVIFNTQVEGNVYVQIWRDNLRLLFTDLQSNILLNTDTLTKYDLGDGCWFWTDKRGRNTCRYSEFTDNPDPTCQYGTQMAVPVKLVSRCWSVPATNVYYVDQQIHANNLELICAEGLSATVEDNFITISDDDLDSQLNAAPGLRTINRISPDSNGNLYLIGDQRCIEVTALDKDGFSNSDPNIVTAKPPHTIEIRNDCTECCACDDYVFWLNVINNLIEIHNYEAAYLRYLIQYYDTLLIYYNKAIEIKLSDLIKLRAIPDQRYTTFNFSVSNPSAASLFDIAAALRVTGTGTRMVVKRMFVYDAHYDISDPGNITFAIPELKSHSTWSGAVSIMWDESGTQAEAEFSVEGLPWCQNTATCTSNMQCNPVVAHEVAIPVPIYLPTEVELPKPPSRVGVPRAMQQPEVEN